LEVLDDGRRVELAGGRQRTLLALLLLHPNEVVSSDRLIDGVWGERPPATAPKVLQNAVSQLRRSLGDDLIVTRAPGYLLRVEPEAIDARRFESRLEEGRDAIAAGRAKEAVEILREALALWRGRPLDDFAYEAFADAEVSRLEELRLRALEERIEADLALGRHADLIGELKRLVTEHPLRERPRGQLMVALYRSARQAEALRVYQDGRRLLAEELGLQPGADLQQLERQILTQDPALASPSVPLPRAERLLRPPRRWLALGFAGLALAVAAVVAAFLLTGGKPAPVVVPSSLVKIDPRTHEVVDVFQVAREPSRPTVVGDYVFVSSTASGILTRLDVDSGEVDTVGRLAGPAEIADGGDGTLWVGSYRGDDTVRQLDAEDYGLRRMLRLRNNSEPWALAVGAGSVWISQSFPAMVSRFDAATGEFQQRYRLMSSEQEIVFANEDAVGEGAAWTATVGPRSGVLRIDLEGGGSNLIEVGEIPYAVTVGYGSVWLTDLVEEPPPTSESAAGHVYRLDPVTEKLTDVIRVGKLPTGVVTGGGSVWVANGGDATVWELDPETGEVMSKIDTGYYPEGLAYGHGYLWVSVQSEPFTF